MTSIDIAASFDELEKLLSDPNGPTEPVLLTKGGRAYAALVPVPGDRRPDAETVATWNSPRFQEILARSREDSRAGREQSLEDVVRELGIGVDR